MKRSLRRGCPGATVSSETASGPQPSEALRHGLVAAYDAVARRRGGAAAVTVEGTGAVSYDDVRRRARGVGLVLSERYGVGGGDRVVISCGGHAAAEVVAILGCAAAGAAWVPAAPGRTRAADAEAAARALVRVAADAGAVAAVIADDADLDACGAPPELRPSAQRRSRAARDGRPLARVGEAQFWAAAVAGAKCCRGAVVLANSGDIDGTVDAVAALCLAPGAGRKRQPAPVPAVAYVLFTSGSTGRPKGVLGTLRGLTARLRWQWDALPWAAGEVQLRRTPLVFVDAVAEILGAVLCGVPLWAPAPAAAARLGAAGIVARAAAAGVTRCTMLPSQLADALASFAARAARWPALRVATVSGEPLWDPEALAATLRGVAPAARLLSLYGSSECAGDVACYEPRAGETSPAAAGAGAPLGRAICGATLVVARPDDRGGWCRCPPGCAGELVVVGPVVAAGYCAPPGAAPAANFLTAAEVARLLASTSGNGDHGGVRMGDRCAVGADGVLRWLGRVDLVRKLRGARVGLERLECVAAGACGGGVACVVVDDGATLVLVRADADAAAPGFVAEPTPPRVAAAFAREGEPCPDLCLVAPSLPRTATGKLDRPRLEATVAAFFDARRSACPPPPPVVARATGGAPPAAGVAAQLADVYRELLPELLAGTAAPDRLDGIVFTLSGGSSLRVVTALARIEARWGVRLAPAALDEPLAAVARSVEAAVARGAGRTGVTSGDGGGPRRVFGSVAEARAYWDATGAATDVARSARCRWAVVPLTASLVRQTAALAATCLSDREPLTVAARLSTRARAALRRFIRRFAFRLLAAPENFSWVAVDVAAPGPPRVFGFSLNELLRPGAAATGDAVVARLGAAAWPLLRLRNRLAALFGVAGLDDAERIYAALYVHWSTTATRGDEPILQLALSGVADSAGGVNAAAVFAALDGAALDAARASPAGIRFAYTLATGEVSQFVAQALGLRPVAQLAPRRAALVEAPAAGLLCGGRQRRLRFVYDAVDPGARVVLCAAPLGAPLHAADAAWDFVVASGGDPARAEALAVLGAAFWDRQRTLAADFDAARDPDRTTILALRVTVGAAPTVVAALALAERTCAGAPAATEVLLLGVRREWRGRGAATRLLGEARRFTTPTGATRVVARAVDTALSAYARAGFVAAADDPTCPYLRLRPGETWVVAPLSGGGATERACERSVLT